MKRLVPVVLLLAAVAAACPTDGTPEASPEPRGTVGTTPDETSTFGRIPGIVEDVSPSVVAVIVETAGDQGEGSGVVWESGDAIITNEHVVSGADRVTVALASGERIEARVRATDPFTDLAVLDAPRDLPPATFADDLPRVGTLAVAIGNPLSFENSATAGIVSGLHRSIPSGGRTPALVDLIQTDAAISPGNSGGALVGADGRVIGINVAFIPPEARAVAIGFAIPAPTVVDVVEQLLETGEVGHAFLGVRPAPITPQVAERFDLSTDEGAIVISVVEGSAAAEAGVRPGDIVTSIGGEQVRNVEDLFAALRNLSPGDSVRVSLLRDGEAVDVRVTLDERAEAQG